MEEDYPSSGPKWELPLETTQEELRAERQRAEWLSMFQIRARTDLSEIQEQDRLPTVARRIARQLREHPTMPAYPQDATHP